MKNKIELQIDKKNKGITLIALVITIIVLLILATITITTLTGENGILNKSNLAGEESKKKEYEEILKIIGNGLRVDKIEKNWNSKTYLDEFENQIKKEEIFKEAQLNRKNDETIIIITKEGHGYKVTENDIEFIGKQGDTEPPKLDESNIKFTYDPLQEEKQWTNESVKVSISSSIENYDLQYSLDGNSWRSYRSRNRNGKQWFNLCKTSK